MGRLMQNPVATLSSEFDVTLVGRQGCGQFSLSNVHSVECPPSPFLFLLTALVKGWRVAKKSSFDIVLGASGLVSPVTCLLAAKAKARSVVTAL